MSFPFGGHPNLASYIFWLKEEHQGTAQSRYTTDKKGQSHALTKLSLPNGKSVVVVGVTQSEYLAPSMVGYLDRRLGVTSPWFSV
jgi:hypothetical protein